MASVRVVFLVLLVSFESAGSGQLISLNSDTGLNPRVPPTSWTSPSSRFEFGFHPHGRGFLLGVWLVGREATLVWTPFRDDPPVSSDAKLLVTNGWLVLRTETIDDKNITGNQLRGSASYASMQDSGNFVLYNQDKDIIWESFKFPTDTILGGQNLSNGGQLLSNLSESNYSTGRFRLKMQADGNLVLYTANAEDLAFSSYWASETWTESNNTRQLYLNDTTGQLLVRDGVSLYPEKILFNGAAMPKHDDGIIYRATLDYDGVFRLYSHSFNRKNEVEVLWSVPKAYKVKSLCGLNSYPERNDNKTHCLCLPGTDFVDRNQLLLGCEKDFIEERCMENKLDAAQYQIVLLKNLTWDDVPYFKESMPSEETCSKSCLEDCDCEAALFIKGYCSRQALPLKYVGVPEESSSAFLKVDLGNKKSKNSNRVVIFVDVGFLTYSIVALALSGFFIFKCRSVVKYRKLLENGKWSMAEDLALRSFSYKELRRATKDFKDKLGKGSFGTVYMGALYNGKKLVAVKRLEKMVEDGEKEFQAEVRAIGRTHHKNLVRLLGYCTEGSKRLLVYEFMSNHSLADLLFSSGKRPYWDERVRIALDVARGIHYLHDECGAPIIHCDIKPHNILMDDSWIAKISDFGLSKLLMPDQTRTFTGVRGTRGYLAPEWQKNIPISVKADIYSYGIVLLELVCCRRNMEVNVTEPEAVVLSTWAYKCFVAGELYKLVGGEEVERKSLEKMVKIGLWCVQDEPALRPSIKSVVLMLEGITEISVPPCPTPSI
ncbi:hypothetical protein PVL29_005333 [Vitis rotundifolia]|uniref:Receptor-like serine/threonine-protein kinase n=1 Tax=Vitis rotundifolia TaxID=103349 RepID=A0AA39E3S1_VITRO|nr:hypothetical protein PVL29_005333 [Vitis rotundifolia]